MLHDGSEQPGLAGILEDIIRIMIDVGVDGVQLDEVELPMTSFQYGGCFFKDYMQGFRLYLEERPQDVLPSEMDGINLKPFQYGVWLKDLGYDFKSNRENTPLFWEYHRFQQRAIKQYFY
jgi:hypothetical protein